MSKGGHGGARGKVGEIEPAPKTERLRRLPAPALWGRFAVFAALLAGAGLGLAESGSTLATGTALSSTSVGFLLTSVSSSTPELVTAVAAARRGAIGLAAGDIIGGNAFDALFIAAADLVSGASLFESTASTALGLCGLALLMNGVLLGGVVRQGHGTRQVDIESLVIIGLWLAAATLVLTD